MANATGRELTRSLKDVDSSLWSIIETAVDAIICIDDSGCITLFNQAAERMFGYPAQDVMGCNVSMLMPEPVNAVHDNYIHRYKATGKTRIVGRGREILAKRKDGTVFPAQLSVSEVPHENDGGYSFTGIIRDVSRQKELEGQLRQHAAVFRHAREGIMIMDAQSRILEVNHAFTVLTGFTPAEAVGQTPSLLFVDHPGEILGGSQQSLSEGDQWHGDAWARNRDGEVFPVWVTAAAVTGETGEVQQYIRMFTDISERKLNEQTMYFRAYHDPLTGLANRALFMEMCEHSRVRKVRNGGQFGVMFLDLDGFKPINDAHGHDVGDGLLREVAGRLREHVRREDTVARLGGDEFTILLEHITDPSYAPLVAGKVIGAFADPFSVAGRQVSVGVSIGVSLYPDHGRDVETLLKAADSAMYRAKQLRGNRYSVWTQDRDARTGGGADTKKDHSA